MKDISAYVVDPYMTQLYKDLQYCCDDAGDLGTAHSNLEPYLSNLAGDLCRSTGAPYQQHMFKYRIWMDLSSRNPEVVLDILIEKGFDTYYRRLKSDLGYFPLYQ